VKISEDRKNPQAPQGAWKGRKTTVLGAGLAVLLGMGAFEGLKQSLWPRLTLWESHFLTIAFSTLAGLLASYWATRRLKGVFERFLAESHERERLHFEQEELFRSAMNHASTGMALIAMDGRYLKVNPAFCAMVGYAEPELLDASLESITHPDDRPADAENIRRMLEGKTVVGAIEKRYIRKDGQVIHCFVSPSIVWDSEGRPRFMVSHIQDFTARKAAEAALAASETRFRHLLEAAAIPMSVAHVSGRIEYLNRHFTQTFGYTLEDIPDLDAWWPKAYPDEGYRKQVIAIVEEAIRKAVETGSDIRPDGEYRVTCKDGSLCIMELTGALVGDQMIVAFHDLTDRVRMEGKLRDALEFNQALLEAQPMGVLAYQASSGQCVMASPVISSAIGATVEEALSQNFRSLESWKESPLLATAERCIATGEPQYVETLIRSTFGKQFWMGAHLATFSSGGLKHLLLLVSDITTRVQAERQHWESERRLLALLEGVDQISVMLDLEGRITFCNDFLLQLTGWRREEVMGRDWFQLFIPRDEAATRRFFLDSIRDGRIDLHFENTIRARDGRLRLVQWTNTLLYEADGGISGTASLGKDITELRRSEEALRASEEKFSRIFQSSPDAIAITDFETGTVYDINPGFTRLLGYEPSEAIGRRTTPGDMALWAEPSARELFRAQMASSGRVANLPAAFLRKDGQAVQVLLSSTLLDVDGTPRALSVIRDVTEHRRIEEERRQLEIQVYKSQRLESLGSLAGGLAHDMNNVLGAILGIASIQQESAPQGSPLRRAMDIILKACVRGRTLVQGLLGFARKGLAEQQELDLNDLVREQVALLERTTLQKVLLQVDLAGDLKPIMGDPGALSHMIMNLCVNAVDAMDSGGALRLSTRNEGPASVRLEVADTGCGMGKEVLDRALDPFFTTKPQGKGTGLGLPIVYGTVKAHGGSLEIESTPQVGSTIRIHLPSCDPGSGGTGQEASAPVPQASLRVLVVDDDELVQTSLELMLTCLHHRTTLAASGEEAIRRFEEGLQVDLLILDMNMPGLGGEAALPHLRALRPDLPVILATGRTDQRALDLAARTAGVTLLSKPFTLEEIRQKILDLTRT
jgi:two-component system, cell cycle sensor histidine kinase and response regulator CckA